MSRSYYRSQAIRSIEEPTVNLTPLIDVVFVILIMFIVVAPLLELDRIDLAEASSDAANKAITVQETSPISIHVKHDNSIWISNRPVTMPELHEFLKQAIKRHPKARPQLFHDHRARFGTYQAIKNALEAAGFQQLDIILKPA